MLSFATGMVLLFVTFALTSQRALARFVADCITVLAVVLIAAGVIPRHPLLGGGVAALAIFGLALAAGFWLLRAPSRTEASLPD